MSGFNNTSHVHAAPAGHTGDTRQRRVTGLRPLISTLAVVAAVTVPAMGTAAGSALDHERGVIAQASATSTRVVTSSSLRVRSSPRFANNIVGQVTAGMTVRVLATSGPWIRIGTNRWVWKAYTRAAASGAAAQRTSYQASVSSLAKKYGCNPALVKVSTRYSSAGTAELVSGQVWIRPGLTGAKLTYVVAHECAHVKQGRIGGAKLRAYMARMNTIYGGTGLRGIERNADCVTLALGLRNQHYTTSCGGARGAAARATLAGRWPS